MYTINALRFCFVVECLFNRMHISLLTTALLCVGMYDIYFLADPCRFPGPSDKGWSTSLHMILKGIHKTIWKLVNRKSPNTNQYSFDRKGERGWGEEGGEHSLQDTIVTVLSYFKLTFQLQLFYPCGFRLITISRIINKLRLPCKNCKLCVIKPYNESIILHHSQWF